MKPRDRLKNVDTPVLFLSKVHQANKIISKNKKIILPAYPNFKKHVTGNAHIFLFGLIRFLFFVSYTILLGCHLIKTIYLSTYLSQVEFPQTMLVSQIATQGNPFNDYWVEKYSLAYRQGNETWKDLYDSTYISADEVVCCKLCLSGDVFFS